MMKLHNTASTVTSAVTLLIVALIIVPFSSIINANANANVNVVNAQQTTTTDEDEQLLAMAMSMSMSMSMLNKQIDKDESEQTQTQTDQQQQTPQTTLNQVQVGNNVFIEDLIPNPNRIMDLSFGYWCSDAAFDCAFRMFTDLAGELVMVDSGSSNLVFCQIPNPTKVYNVKRLVKDTKYLSQCATFSGGSHGWFGPSFIGAIVELDDQDESTPTQNSVFSVMEKIVGMNGNSCGPIRNNSIGLELSAVRGIWGIGGIPGSGYNNFIYNDELDINKWPEKGDRMVQADNPELKGAAICPDADTGCVCPAYQAELPSNFNVALARNKSDRYSISWDGTFGKNTGKLRLGDNIQSTLNNTDNSDVSSQQISSIDALPKIELHRDSVDLGVLRTNISRIEVNDIDIPINITSYYVDTGSPSIYLPSQIYDAIKFEGGINITNITFFIPSLTGVGEIKIDMSTTQELMNDGTFVPAREGSGTLIMGLNIMRYAQTIEFSFAPNPSPYMQILPRSPHLLTPIKEILLSDNGVAGSLTNVSFDIDAYKTPTITTSGGGRSMMTMTTFIAAAVVSTVLLFLL